MSEDFLPAIAPVVFGGFAMFCAIMLWPRTRDRGWMFVILSVIFGYAGIVIAALEKLGLFHLATGAAWLDTVVGILIGNGTYILMAAGLLLACREHGRGRH